MAKAERLLEAVVVAMGVVVFVDFLVVATVHARTLFAVNQTSGAWLSYARAFSNGVLYPPPSDGGFYAGTRYFPAYFVTHALVGRVTGEFLTSGKLVTYASAIIAFSAMVEALTRRTGRRRLALGISGVFFATWIGFKAAMTIRGDLFPLALSLAAMTRLERWDMTRKNVDFFSAAVLSGLAPLGKFTSLHALTAGTLWLLFRARGRALGFALVGAATLVLGITATELASSGRFLASMENGALAPPLHAQDLPHALQTYLRFLGTDRAFIPIGALAAGAALLEARRPTLFGLYFGLHAIVAIGFFLDIGAEQNHLVDLVAGSFVLAGGLVRGAPSIPLRLATLGALVLTAVVGLLTHHRAAWEAPDLGQRADSVIDALGVRGRKLLSHDPTIAVLAGQRPVVADDFQYRVMVFRSLIPEDDLPSRIAAREFERIVLLNPPEPGPDARVFADLELGVKAARAIRTFYALDRHVGRWYVFAPRSVEAQTRFERD